VPASTAISTPSERRVRRQVIVSSRTGLGKRASGQEMTKTVSPAAVGFAL
jgi:hypothetical protein